MVGGGTKKSFPIRDVFRFKAIRMVYVEDVDSMGSSQRGWDLW